MPANVVHSPEQERLWSKAKARAEAQGRAKDWRYVMGIFKRMGGLGKSLVPAQYRLQRIPGQVPSRERMADMRDQRDLERMPRQPEIAQLLQNTDPMGSAASVVRGMGFDARASQNWESFLEKAVASATNELVLRQAVISQTREARLQPELRQAILERALSFWRTARKSMVRVVTVDELQKGVPSANADLQKAEPHEQPVMLQVECSPEKAQVLFDMMRELEQLDKNSVPFKMTLDSKFGKFTSDITADSARPGILGVRLQKAEPRGGAYHRRVPQGEGYRYIYDPEKYQSRPDAHVDGREARRQYLHGKICKAVGERGDQGAHLRELRDEMAERFHPDEVEEALKGCAGGKLEFRKGRFYLRTGATEGAEKSFQPKFIVRR